MEWVKIMIKPEIEVVKVIDWSHVSLKPGEEGILCQCGKAVLFRTDARTTRQTITLQCPKCGRKIVYG
jgi:predicted RNA-binding Zn-ribbon protein involved in translation (DUF1610 family)